MRLLEKNCVEILLYFLEEFKKLKLEDAMKFYPVEDKDRRCTKVDELLKNSFLKRCVAFSSKDIHFKDGEILDDIEYEKQNIKNNLVCVIDSLKDIVNKTYEDNILSTLWLYNKSALKNPLKQDFYENNLNLFLEIPGIKNYDKRKFYKRFFTYAFNEVFLKPKLYDRGYCYSFFSVLVSDDGPFFASFPEGTKDLLTTYFQSDLFGKDLKEC